MQSVQQFPKKKSPTKPSNIIQMTPLIDGQRQNYEQFKNIYLTSFLIEREKKKIKTQVDSFVETLSQIEKLFIENQNELAKQAQAYEKYQYSEKRSRRKADAINRRYECKGQRCNKKYGTYATLLQHIKFKHPKLYGEYFSI